MSAEARQSADTRIRQYWTLLALHVTRYRARLALLAVLLLGSVGLQGVHPQAPRLFSETLRNNVLLGLQAGDEKLMHAIRPAVLEEDLDGLSFRWQDRRDHP